MKTIVKLIGLSVPIVLGLLGALLLYVLGESEPEQAPKAERVDIVEVMDVTPQTLYPLLSGTGVVEAEQQTELVSQVNSQVVSLAPGFQAGRRFQKGEVIARLDDTAFRAAVADGESRVAKAEQDLALELGRGQVARSEKGITGIALTEAEQSIVFREPQLKAVKAELKSAFASLRSAKRDLALTTMRAPFDSVLVEESLDLGKVVTSGAVVGRLLGDASLLVKVALPFSALPLVNVSGQASGGSEARLRVAGIADTPPYRGVVTGTTGEVDATTRNVTLVVAVESDPTVDIPLMPGAFVEVELVGKPVPGAFRLPESAIHRGSTVWLVDDHERLFSAQVHTIWRERGHVLVKGDLAGGRLVTSALPHPIKGQLARTQGEP